MRRIFYSRFGGPGFCSLNTAIPQPGPGQIRVRVAGCSVNPSISKPAVDWVLCPKTLGQRFSILCPVMMSAAWWTP